MTQDAQKQLVAREALRYVVDDAWLGVGSVSTANFFIDELARIKHRIKGAIASSDKTAARLASHGIDVEERVELLQRLAGGRTKLLVEPGPMELELLTRSRGRRTAGGLLRRACGEQDLDHLH